MTSPSEYSKLVEQWRVFARKMMKSAPKEVKASIYEDADKVFDDKFSYLSRASQTGKRVTAGLVMAQVLQRCGLRLPMSCGFRPIPTVPTEHADKRRWKQRVDLALAGLTSVQHKELEDEIYRRTRGPVNAEHVADEVKAQFTQIGG